MHEKYANTLRNLKLSTLGVPRVTTKCREKVCIAVKTTDNEARTKLGKYAELVLRIVVVT